MFRLVIILLIHSFMFSKPLKNSTPTYNISPTSRLIQIIEVNLNNMELNNKQLESWVVNLQLRVLFESDILLEGHYAV